MMQALDGRILNVYESLTPQERRLADVLLEHQRELAGYSASELARKAGVSKATAARLFKRLGYANYEEAKRQARKHRLWGSPLGLLDDLSAFDAAQPNVMGHLQNEIANLSRTYQSLRSEDLDNATDILASAERIWLVGFRGNHPLAEIAAFWLKHIRPDISFVPSSWVTFAEDTIDLSERDAVLAIGFRRRSRIFRALLEHAANCGAKIILVTDLSASSTAKFADIVLRCHSRPSYLFDSYAAAISILNYLVSNMALRQETKTRTRLRRIEDLHEQLDAFTLPSRPRRRPSRISAPDPSG